MCVKSACALVTEKHTVLDVKRTLIIVFGMHAVACAQVNIAIVMLKFNYNGKHIGYMNKR